MSERYGHPDLCLGSGQRWSRRRLSRPGPGRPEQWRASHRLVLTTRSGNLLAHAGDWQAALPTSTVRKRRHSAVRAAIMVIVMTHRRLAPSVPDLRADQAAVGSTLPQMAPRVSSGSGRIDLGTVVKSSTWSERLFNWSVVGCFGAPSTACLVRWACSSRSAPHSGNPSNPAWGSAE